MAQGQTTSQAGAAKAPENARGTAKSADAAAGVTPSMAQYLEIKTANPDSLLWYRMGDFYELFFEDAVVASAALSIVLTKRGKHLGEDIPMCGVPVARADEYLQRLIRQGYRVAVCEQLEDPAEARKRGSKAVVKRDVVRLVTPGTLTEETLLDAKAANYLVAVHDVPEADGAPASVALAAFDLSTGELEVGAVPAPDLDGEIVRLAPGEILISDRRDAPAGIQSAAERSAAAVTAVPGQSFDSLAGETALKAGLGVSDLGAFGSFSRGELATLGALFRYVELTQVGQRTVVQSPRRIGADASVIIDAATRASLEITRGASGDRGGSLLAAIDRTVTGPGARLLGARIAAPLTTLPEIRARQDAVGFFIDQDIVREDIRACLKAAPDVARAVSRLALMRGGPRDLGAVRDALAAAATLDQCLAPASASGLPKDIAAVRRDLTGVAVELRARLDAALDEDLPPIRRDGGFIRAGFDTALDEARALRDDSRAVMAGLEARYGKETGVRGLKIRHNNLLGYFLEATSANAKPLLEAPLSDTFRHRQTMANAVRFVTDELVKTEGKIASAGGRALAREQELFQELADAIRAAEPQLARLGAALADLDCLTALGELARSEGYVRPEVTDDPGLAIISGRHPVVEQALRAATSDPFIANDCVLGDAGDGTPRPPGFEQSGDARVWLVTGPNMAGKSTFLRQTALIVLMAQAGSFVPAEQARIGIVDRIFSRVGASDDLARGRSTFMVEMVETAAILTQATDRSLVVLDEVGRGTSTFDGLSIAWAAVEHLHDQIGCRALFATHYHEMTALADRLASVASVTMDVKEWRDEIVFLHRVRPGAANRSYGIQVARLAGLPGDVIARAGEVLAVLEDADQGRGSADALTDLPLFEAARPKSVTMAQTGAAPSPLQDALDDVRPDELSPRAALDLLYKLKALARGD